MVYISIFNDLLKTMVKYIKLLFASFILLAVLSCISVICTRQEVIFKNMTQDTLWIGVSHYDCIDSVEFSAWPNYSIKMGLDTILAKLKNGTNVTYGDFIYPDSSCAIDTSYFVSRHGPCYLFLVRLHDAKNNSWADIKSQKLFHCQIVTRGNGNFDRNISYSSVKKGKEYEH